MRRFIMFCLVLVFAVCFAPVFCILRDGYAEFHHDFKVLLYALAYAVEAVMSWQDLPVLLLITFAAAVLVYGSRLVRVMSSQG